MKLSLPLLRRRPAPAGASTSAMAELLGVPPRDEGLGTPWTPPTVHGGTQHELPLSATVLERSRNERASRADQVVYQATSLLLDYPDADLAAQLGTIRAAIEADVRGAAATHLLTLLDHLESTPLDEAQRHYVETFDMRRRCCLHLTYYAYGDTRRRGMALLDLKQTYQACGVDLVEDELPDHLCVLLGFAASVNPSVGRTLLLDHRAGIELLRISLADRDSIYVHAIEAVCATLPALVGRDRDAVRSLIASGPPDEQVGMEAYMSGSAAASGVRV